MSRYKKKKVIRISDKNNNKNKNENNNNNKNIKNSSIIIRILKIAV